MPLPTILQPASFHHTFTALTLAAACAACTRTSQAPVAQPAPQPTPHPAPPTPPSSLPAEAHAFLSRMMGGEWHMQLATGPGLISTWHWGPGRHSLRAVTDGTGGDGNPWRALAVTYWHPGHQQLRSLELSTYASGVAESTLTITGETSEAITDIYQGNDRRDLKSLTVFTSPDTSHNQLFERTNPKDYFLLAEWDWARHPAPATSRALAVPGAPKPSQPLQAFAPMLDATWQADTNAQGDWAADPACAAAHIHSTVEWVPLCNGISIRTTALTPNAEPTHLLDTYIYHHPGTKTARCLALTHRGGVYEGTITTADGALEVSLNRHESDHTSTLTARIDLDQSHTTFRLRLWSTQGPDRTLLLDTNHTKRP